MLICLSRHAADLVLIDLFPFSFCAIEFLRVVPHDVIPSRSVSKFDRILGDPDGHAADMKSQDLKILIGIFFIGLFIRKNNGDDVMTVFEFDTALIFLGPDLHHVFYCKAETRIRLTQITFETERIKVILIVLKTLAELLVKNSHRPVFK